MNKLLQWIAVASCFLILVACQNNEQSSENGASASEEQRQKENEDDQDDNAGQRLSPPDTAAITLGNWTVTVSYGSPSVRDREIWGDLVPYDKVWRTGANEATVFQTNRPASVLGKSLPPGKYALFTIPGKESWTVIFNKVWNQWGAYEYNENEDAVRVMVEPQELNTFSEQLTFDLEQKGDDTVELTFMWEQLQLSLPIEKSD